MTMAKRVTFKRHRQSVEVLIKCGFGQIIRDLFPGVSFYRGIRHIRSRVSHPQTKEKVGRFFREVDQCLWKMKTIVSVIH